MIKELSKLTRADSTDSPYEATERNVEVATGYALRTAEAWMRRAPAWVDPLAFNDAVIAAVLRASQDYKPDNPTRATFFTYAHALVKGACKEADRNLRRVPPSASLDSFSPFVDPYSGSDRTDSNAAMRWNERSRILSDRMADDTPTPEDNLMSGEFARDLFSRIAPSVLDERETGIILLRYVRNMKQKEIAEYYGVTAGRIHQIEDAAMRKIRAFLGVTVPA